ncbi:MAG: hypothetical protein AB9869_17820 [Verrucomicrobiia bacterium]
MMLDFNGIRVGDAFTKHESKFETSTPDSDLPDYRGKTYYYKSYPRSFAKVQFDLLGIGVESGVIENFYFWLRTRESKLPDLRKAATDFLNQHYAKSGISMTEKSRGPRVYERVWTSPDHEMILKTVIDGKDPLTDRWATAEIFVSKRKGQDQSEASSAPPASRPASRPEAKPAVTDKVGPTILGSKKADVDALLKDWSVRKSNRASSIRPIYYYTKDISAIVYFRDEKADGVAVIDRPGAGVTSISQTRFDELVKLIGQKPNPGDVKRDLNGIHEFYVGNAE